MHRFISSVLLCFASVLQFFPCSAVAGVVTCSGIVPMRYRNDKISITDFGGVGDGRTLNTKAFREAIYRIEHMRRRGGTLLYIPPGEYLTGSFNLTSHMTLYLAKGAVIKATQDTRYWPLIAPLPSYGRGRERPGGRYISLIHGDGLHDVVITGENGTIDGQGDVWWNMWRQRTLKFTRPSLIEFMNSRSIIISNVIFKNSPFWNIHPVYCSKVVIQYVTILAPADSPNTDGIDPDSSSHVCIEDSYISTGDDLVSVKSGWDEYGIAYGQPSCDITIRRLTGSSPFAGIAIGSETSGGISNVLAENINLYNMGVGIHVKTNIGRGGYIKNITVSDVYIENARKGIKIAGDVGDHPDEKFNPNALPAVEDVKVRNVWGERVLQPGSIQGLRDAPFKGICLSNINLHGAVGPGNSPWKCSDVSGAAVLVSPWPCSELASTHRARANVLPMSPDSSALTREGSSKVAVDPSPACGFSRVLQGQELSTLRGAFSESNDTNSTEKPIGYPNQVDDNKHDASANRRYGSEKWLPLGRAESSFTDLLSGFGTQINSSAVSSSNQSGIATSNSNSNSMRIQLRDQEEKFNQLGSPRPMMASNLSLNLFDSGMKSHTQNSTTAYNFQGNSRYGGFNDFSLLSGPRDWFMPPPVPSYLQPVSKHQNETVKPKDNHCKLFGIPLFSSADQPTTSRNALIEPDSQRSPALETGQRSEQPKRPRVVDGPVQNNDKEVQNFQGKVHSGSTRSCTKVHKQGIALGRSVDLTKFNNYDQLISELDKIFEFSGELKARNKSWMIVYTDDEGDMMLVGDDPWQEFCGMVRKIFIYTREEVQRMNPGTLNSREENSSVAEGVEAREVNNLPSASSLETY